MASVSRLLSLCASMMFVGACGLSADLGEGEGESDDRASDEELGGETCDGGPCTDGEPRPAACGQLLTSTCGLFNECQEDPGCVAASLLADFRSGDCAAALSDARSYPRCTSSSCDELVVRVCGDDDRCNSSASCAPARELQGRFDDGDVDAGGSCAAALTDETLFPTCL